MDATRDDTIREALYIFRNTFRPRVRELLDRQTTADRDILRERDVIGPFDEIQDIKLGDPMVIVQMLMSLDRLRPQIFPSKHSDQALLDNLHTVRTVRNGWAHLDVVPPEQRNKFFAATVWLLEQSGEANAARRVAPLSDLASQRDKSARIHQHSQETATEINKRAQALATQERQVQKREQEVTQLETRLEEDRDDLDRRAIIVTDQEQELAERRSVLEQREVDLQRAPDADTLHQRASMIDAEGAAVAKSREQLRQTAAEYRIRLNLLRERETEIQRREAAFDQQEAELDRSADAAAELSERLMDTVERLEQLERQALAGRTLPEPPVIQIEAAAKNGHLRSCRRPDCHGQLEPKIGRFGPFMGCNNFPECRYSEDIDRDPSEPPADYGSCPDCNNFLQIRHGSDGQFLGCSNYPRCRYTQSLGRSDDEAEQPAAPDDVLLGRQLSQHASTAP